MGKLSLISERDVSTLKPELPVSGNMIAKAQRQNVVRERESHKKEDLSTPAHL